jgi:hypothetical protein
MAKEDLKSAVFDTPDELTEYVNKELPNKVDDIAAIIYCPLTTIDSPIVLFFKVPK